MNKRHKTKEVRRAIRSKAEAIALSNFLWNEGMRHVEDIHRIVDDLRSIEKKWKVKPRRVREFVEV